MFVYFMMAFISELYLCQQNNDPIKIKKRKNWNIFRNSAEGSESVGSVNQT